MFSVISAMTLITLGRPVFAAIERDRARRKSPTRTAIGLPQIERAAGLPLRRHASSTMSSCKSVAACKYSKIIEKKLSDFYDCRKFFRKDHKQRSHRLPPLEIYGWHLGNHSKYGLNFAARAAQYMRGIFYHARVLSFRVHQLFSDQFIFKGVRDPYAGNAPGCKFFE
jgi:hypothetical protein